MLTVKDASLITGISRNMLRHNEKLGIISPGRNPDNHYRDYTSEDINNAVMVKQYSNLGLSLKILSHLSRQGDISAALAEFQETIGRLELDLNLARARLENARDYHHLFSLLQEEPVSDTGVSPITYYYPRSLDAPYFSAPDSSLYGVIRPVFCIAPEHVTADPFPERQGFLSLQQIPSYPLPFVTIPAHCYWRTILEEEHDAMMNRDKLALVLGQMKKMGYQLQGNVLLYQIMSANEYNPRKLTCIECDIGPFQEKLPPPMEKSACLW